MLYSPKCIIVTMTIIIINFINLLVWCKNAPIHGVP